jgi:hypothetical protein
VPATYREERAITPNPAPAPYPAENRLPQHAPNWRGDAPPWLLLAGGAGTTREGNGGAPGMLRDHGVFREPGAA